MLVLVLLGDPSTAHLRHQLRNRMNEYERKQHHDRLRRQGIHIGAPVCIIPDSNTSRRTEKMHRSHIVKRPAPQRLAATPPPAATGATPPTPGPNDQGMFDALVSALAPAGISRTSDGESILAVVQQLVDAYRPSAQVAASYGLSASEMQIIRQTPGATPATFIAARASMRRNVRP